MRDPALFHFMAMQIKRVRHQLTALEGRAAQRRKQRQGDTLTDMSAEDQITAMVYGAGRRRPDMDAQCFGRR